MTERTRLGDEERARIVDAITAGHTRNQIARDFNRSPGTITRIAQAEGLAFDRTMTKCASEAKRVDNLARRRALAEELLVKGERLLGQMFARTKVFSFGGKENSYEEHEIPEPTFADKRHIAGAARMLITTSIDLDRHDQEPDDNSAVGRWLQYMTGSSPEVDD